MVVGVAVSLAGRSARMSFRTGRIFRRRAFRVRDCSRRSERSDDSKCERGECRRRNEFGGDRHGTFLPWVVALSATVPISRVELTNCSPSRRDETTFPNEATRKKHHCVSVYDDNQCPNHGLSRFGHKENAARMVRAALRIRTIDE
jgi:hypothetical protein